MKTKKVVEKVTEEEKGEEIKNDKLQLGYWVQITKKNWGSVEFVLFHVDDWVVAWWIIEIK